MTAPITEFHIHGDNIVECERTIDLIKRALVDITTSFTGPTGSPVCPGYDVILSEPTVSLVFTSYPGFGRWDQDVLALIKQHGGTLREAADVIITGVVDGEEIPLLAIEYCGALLAGNQAWQRSGRAYSSGKAQIPYLYVAELGGYELGPNRERRAPRMPNPAVPFSYISFSMTNDIPTLPIFLTAPGADETSRANYASVFAEEELLSLIRSIIMGENNEDASDSLRSKALSFVEKKARASRAGVTLTPDKWEQAFSALERGESLVDFLVDHAQLRWRKSISIAITPTARQLLDAAIELAIGMTSNSLPMCIIPRQNRSMFAESVQRLYGDSLHADFISWLLRDRHLSICWVAGFKPRGDDSRPDRGLLPFTRMLIGQEEDLLTIVYGPAPTATWNRLHNAPRELLANGLWQALFDGSDALLVDSTTDEVNHHGYLRSHWHEDRAQAEPSQFFVQPTPVRIGENDVDTVLHLLLAHHAGPSVFEGMCNPPGGDWSGISLLSADKVTELRWLTLPRVSNNEAKRPDHVFQIFRPDQQPMILSVESKETAASVETNIGPRLTSYLQDLLCTPASVEREPGTQSWAHSTINLDTDDFLMASAVAFKADTAAKTAHVKDRANADLLLAFEFENNCARCSIQLMPVTSLGREIAEFMGDIPLEETQISIEVIAP